MRRMTWAVIGVAAAASWKSAVAQEGVGDKSTLRHSAIVDGPVADVWTAFTTKEGLESWMVAQADIDLRVGGKMRTRYAAGGTLGDAETIENTILSFEPGKMISIRATKPPHSFPYQTVIQAMWTVVDFEEVAAHRTRVTVTSMGFGNDEESLKMREHFDKGNAWTLDKLRAKFARAHGEREAEELAAAATDSVQSVKRIGAEIVVRTSLKSVWEAWTTPAGIATFFAPASKVELRPGGAYEMYFGPDQPRGSQGSEGCTILACRPMEMLSFTWNAPPKWPAIRNQRTVVVLQFEDLDERGVRVGLTHAGFGQGKEWSEVHEYFSQAWPRVLGRLKDQFAARSGVREVASE